MSSVEVFAGDRAANYDDFVETWIPCYSKFISLIPYLLLSQSKAVNEVLIAGCGTGNEIKAMADASSDWQLTGVDPSAEMVQQAQQKLADYSHINIIEGTVADLPMNNDQQYDAATLLLVLHFIKDDGSKLVLLKDVANRLKPQAPLITFDITGDPLHIEQNLSVLTRLLPKGIDKAVIEFRLERMRHRLHHVTEHRFIELCREAGFITPIKFFQSTVYMGWLFTKA